MSQEEQKDWDKRATTQTANNDNAGDETHRRREGLEKSSEKNGS